MTQRTAKAREGKVAKEPVESQELQPILEALRPELALLHTELQAIQTGEEGRRAAVAAELESLRDQLAALRSELQAIRTMADFQFRALQGQACSNDVQSNRAALQATMQHTVIRARESEEDSDRNGGEGTGSGYEAALPLPRDIRLPGRDAGPAPIVLLGQRRGEGKV